MAIISESVILDIVAILATVSIGIYTYFQWCYRYWERKHIPYIKPRFPFGTFKLFSNPPVSMGEMCKQNYKYFKAKEYKHGGIFIFSTPIYMPIDPEYIKNMMTTYFDHFVDRGTYYNEKHDPLSANMFGIEGTKWRNIRTKVTPTFTSGKMKLMFQTVVECGTQLKEAMDIMVCGESPINIKDVLARFTTNIIGSCAFGIDCNCFIDPNAEFRRYGKRVFNLTPFENLQLFIGFTSPGIARKLGFKITPNDVTNFFLNVIEETVTFREQNNVERKDFLQLLIEIKNSVKDDNGKGIGLTMKELAAQAFIFFLAGYESSSTLMTFCLFELTQNLGIQQKVREEISKVLKEHNDEVTYDALMEMKYMGQVIDETLRKYPPVTYLIRKCVKDYKIPDTDIVLSNGTSCIISVLGLHRDPEYFPDPEKFDPDRFGDENKSRIRHFSYLPFGEGPRACIGIRFGVMQAKMGLTILLKNYKFTFNSKTHLPFKVDPYSLLIYSVEGDIWLNVERI